MGNTSSAHKIDEMTSYLNKTPFFVYFNPIELRDFAKCFTAKRITKGHAINQTGAMYIVAEGEIAMTTMLTDTGEYERDVWDSSVLPHSPFSPLSPGTVTNSDDLD